MNKPHRPDRSAGTSTGTGVDQRVDRSTDRDAGSARAERPSKSQLKREMSELQALGERLLALPPAKLRALPISEALIEAVELAQRINAREGLRRQRQYIGRLMRDIDPQPLRDALDADGAQHRAEVQVMHAAERWRERLLEDPRALDALDAAHPGAAQALAPLVERARAERGRSGEAAGRAYRALYRSLRDLLDGAKAPANEATTSESKASGSTAPQPSAAHPITEDPR